MSDSAREGGSVRIRVKRRREESPVEAYVVHGGPSSASAKRSRVRDALEADALSAAFRTLGTTAVDRPGDGETAEGPGMGIRHAALDGQRGRPLNRFVFRRVGEREPRERERVHQEDRPVKRRLREVRRTRDDASAVVDFVVEEVDRPVGTPADLARRAPKASPGNAVLSPFEREWRSAVESAATSPDPMKHLGTIQRLCSRVVTEESTSGRHAGGIRSADLFCSVRNAAQQYRAIGDGAPKGEGAAWQCTALMVATAANHAPLVEVLLSCGADPLRRDEFGRSAIDIAEDKGATRCRLLLADAILRSREASRTPLRSNEESSASYVYDVYVLDKRDTKDLWEGTASSSWEEEASTLVVPGLVASADGEDGVTVDLELDFGPDADWEDNGDDVDSNDEGFYANDYPDEEDEGGYPWLSGEEARDGDSGDELDAMAYAHSPFAVAARASGIDYRNGRDIIKRSFRSFGAFGADAEDEAGEESD